MRDAQQHSVSNLCPSLPYSSLGRRRTCWWWWLLTVPQKPRQEVHHQRPGALQSERPAFVVLVWVLGPVGLTTAEFVPTGFSGARVAVVVKLPLGRLLPPRATPVLTALPSVPGRVDAVSSVADASARCKLLMM